MVKTPGKELRFTRSKQAAGFWMVGFALVLASTGLGVLSWWQLRNPPPWWAALFPLAAAAGVFWLAWRLTRHAYLLLSPVGLEIFPFWKPVDNFRLVTWGEIAGAEFSPDGRWLHLTLAGYEDAKIILTLDPVATAARPLLQRAITGLLEKRGQPPAGDGEPELTASP